MGKYEGIAAPFVPHPEVADEVGSTSTLGEALMVNKKVLVCCGTGIATSVQVANKLQRMLRDRGITATMKECKTANVPAQMTTFQPDAIVVTTAITPPDEEIKVYRGTPLLTGVDAEELADQIASDLKA